MQNQNGELTLKKTNRHLHHILTQELLGLILYMNQLGLNRMNQMSNKNFCPEKFAYFDEYDKEGPVRKAYNSGISFLR